MHIIPDQTPPPSRYALAAAVAKMTSRYGAAEREHAYAVARWLHAGGTRDDAARWERACHRRFRAVQRLTNALRDLPAAGSWAYQREADDAAGPERPHIGWAVDGAR